MTNIISIQSTVLNDLVGNQAARYMLNSKQYNFYDNICKYFEHSGDKITASIPHEKLDFIVHPSEGLDFQDEPTYDYGRLMDTIMDRMLERNLVQDDELVVSC